MYPVEDLRAYLVGAWRVERLFTDRQTGKRNEFAGSATFTSVDDSLLYEEQILTVLDDYEGISTQSYRYTFADTDCADVSFGDGRAFHSLSLTSGICHVQHDCEPDTYDGVFRSVTEHEWRVRWKVIGPRKHYFLESRYIRKQMR